MRKKYLLLVLFLLGACSGLRAQTFNLQTGREPVASLDGLWRFHTGDNPAWASPNFDDSHWPLLRSDEDWAKQGYKDYSGMAWYRFTVQVADGGKPLSLLLPSFNTSYQVFADARPIGGCGVMPPHPVAHSCHPQVIALGRGSSSATRTIAIAIRVWHWPAWASFYGGGPDGTGYIGAPNLIRSQFQSSLDARAKLALQYYFLIVFAFLGALVSLALFFSRRGDREYLWFGIMLLLETVDEAAYVYRQLHSIPIVSFFGWNNAVASLGWLAAIAFYYVLLHGRRSWLFYLAIAGASLHLFAEVSFFSFYTYVRVGMFNVVSTVLLVPLVLWILVLLAQRAQEKVVDARLLLVPVVLLYGNFLLGGFVYATFQLGWQHRYADETFPVFSRPFPLNSDLLAEFIFLVAMVAILVNRFARTSREEERYASELEAARTVQSLLIPATPPGTPGFAVESVYLPASEVGGDFFQILPGEDGSLLIVVGDVSGKGLKAAMTVSTIVGALRGCGLRQPAAVLANLNPVLHGQITGFVTCSAVLITADGLTTIANAGNLAPYRNGAELAVDSGLPLGILPEIGYTETTCQLAEGDRLTFVSDGVVEATNEKRELFGFERTLGISGRTAQAIADAARDFGQQDDISVLTVRFLAPVLV